MLRGIATVNYWATDHAAAKAWYSELLGMAPYFERPGYCEFRIGARGDELGIIDARFAPEGWVERPGGATLYWHVDDVRATLDRLLAMGALLHDDVQQRGEGFVTASVIDPFGNVLGIMYNQHFLDVAASHAPAGHA